MKIWLPCSLLLGLALPANAQFGFPIIPVPDAPAAKPEVIPEADVNAWLQNAKKAAEQARTAQKNGDTTKRDAAIQEVATWVSKVCDPYGVTDAKRLEAVEIVGPLARDMAQWKATFGDTKLIMVDVRLGTLIDNAKGQQKAQLLTYRGDLSVAQDYSFRAFEHFGKVMDIPEADNPTVRYAIERAVLYIPNSDRSAAKPLYNRMLTLPLTPVEKADWEMKRHLYIVDVEWKGEDFDKSLAAIKTALADPKLDARQRNVLAATYQEHLFGDEKVAFIDQMIKDTAATPALQSRWYFERGKVQVGDNKWKEAVADYEQAAKLAPLGSAERDDYLLTTTIVKMDRLGVKDGVQPTLEALIKSPHLTADERLGAASRLFKLSYDAKNFAAAKNTMTEARSLAGEDVWKQIPVDVNIILAQLGLNDVEGAQQTWKAIPFAKVNDAGFDTKKREVANSVTETGLKIYQAAVQAKKWPVAQDVLDVAEKNNVYTLGDRQLMKANLYVVQGEYDKAIIVLNSLLVIATLDSDKATLNAMITNVEKMKNAKPAKANG